jgi:Na+/melibiose symporter-like transporter
MGLIAVGLGLVMTSIFYLFTAEPVGGRRHSRLNYVSSDTSGLGRMTWRSWFKQIHFYQVALVYMLSRLYVNVSQVYFPFYITIVQKEPKQYVAILPMVSYLSSFVLSLLVGIPCFNRRLNRKYFFMFGSLIGIANCALMHLQLADAGIFGVSVLLGLTQAILLIASIGVTGELINKNTAGPCKIFITSVSLFRKVALLCTAQ